MAADTTTVSLVLGSGGARGLAHIGVIQWLTGLGLSLALGMVYLLKECCLPCLGISLATKVVERLHELRPVLESLERNPLQDHVLGRAAGAVPAADGAEGSRRYFQQARLQQMNRV